MVNGNYILYGERPSSDSEFIDDHVRTRTADRKKNKRKFNRSANDLHRTLNMAQLDNETDSIKYEKKVKQPKLLRYVSTTDVEENFVNDNFETHDIKSEEPPRRYSFTKKPKNPTDGSVYYAYSRSSSSCSSPTSNLPTITEHVEQFGTYRVRTPPSPTDSENLKEFDVKKLDKYFVSPKRTKKFAPKINYNGTHPDSLYRVQSTVDTEGSKIRRMVRLLRWPVSLLLVCVALTVFVYYLMPDTIDGEDKGNATYWEASIAGAHLPAVKSAQQEAKTETTKVPHGTKTPEIDFYDADNNNPNVHTLLNKLRDMKAKSKLPVQPVFPTNIAPEVQYGNEKADTDKLRSPKVLAEDNTVIPLDSTLKPHITQQPEKPLAIYLNEDITTSSAESISKLQPTNDFVRHEGNRNGVEIDAKKIYQYGQKQVNAKTDLPRNGQYIVHQFVGTNTNFTSGHSKVFGVGIEDAERFRSTTQSTIYNTKVSPTLPVWRDGDDTTTLKYPTNPVQEGQVQCRSTRLSICRDVLPYDLAMVTPSSPGGVDINTLLPQIEFLVTSNCSDRVKHLVCALLEPECSLFPDHPKLPCFNLCKAVAEGCEGAIPRDLLSTFNCQLYPKKNCAPMAPPCFSSEAQCNDGSCIVREWICDGRPDCDNGEDEVGCALCDRHEFRCRDNSCIQKRWLCDGYSDCVEGEDETEEACTLIAPPPPTERGAEAAESAPAPAVRRPNKLSTTAIVENESSKELLMTSDSSNGLKRNFTRRPSLSRLSPYSRTYSPKPVETTTLSSLPTTEAVSTLNTSASLPQEFKPINKSFRKTDMNPPRRVPQKPTANSKPSEVMATQNDAKKIEDNLTELVDNKTIMRNKTEDIKNLDDYMKIERQNLQITKTAEESFSLLTATINALARILQESESQVHMEGVKDPEQAHKQIPITQDMPFSSHSSPCPSGELRCVDGRCITIAQLCDGIIDCTDHADEDNCFT